MHIVNAPSQGVGQIVRETPLTPPTDSLPALNSQTKDVLMQFKNNLLHLEDMSSRVAHLLTEVRSVIRR